MDAQPMKLGTPVYVVVRVSKYLTTIHSGRIITWDQNDICYAHEGEPKFADRTLCYPNRESAENRKREIEREAQ